MTLSSRAVPDGLVERVKRRTAHNKISAVLTIEELRALLDALSAKDRELAEAGADLSASRKLVDRRTQERDREAERADGNYEHYRDMIRERDEAMAALREKEEDAERWRALMSSQRMHMMGSFGFDYVFDPPDSKKTADLVDVIPRHGDHMHFGIEFWSEHSAFGDPAWPDTLPRKLLTTYVDELRARSLSSGQHVSGSREQRGNEEG